MNKVIIVELVLTNCLLAWLLAEIEKIRFEVMKIQMKNELEFILSENKQDKNDKI